MPDARRAYEAALAAASDDAERCRAWIGLAAVKRVTDDLEGASADLASAEAAVAATRGLVAEEARGHLLRGNLCFPRGDVAGCLREHGLALERARRAGSPEVEAQALSGLGDAEYGRGRMATAHGHFRRCVALCRERGLGRIEVANLGAAGLTRLHLGDTRGATEDLLAAVRALERAMATSRETRVRYLGAVIAGEIAAVAESADARARALAEGEAILAAGAMSHNHL